MVVIKYLIDGCQFIIEDQLIQVVTFLLDLHAIQYKQQQVTATSQINVSKLIRIHIDMDIDQEAWLYFTRRWKTYRYEGIAAIQHF